jgi:hypothetical protein
MIIWLVQIPLLLLFLSLYNGAAAAFSSQIHLAQGKTPSSMTVSWITPTNDTHAVVLYGKEPRQLSRIGYATTDQYTYVYNTSQYVSGYIHHATLYGLEPRTKYYYYIYTPDNNDKFDILPFMTLPDVGDHSELTFAVIGDLGQTEYSASTIRHIMREPGVQMVLHAGDLAYADCNQPLWDTYGYLIEPLAKSVPWMVCAGNHEVEYNGSDYARVFTAFEKRYRMPQIRSAEFGDIIIPSSISPTKNSPYCTPSVFQMEYNYGNSFYSFDSGMAHIIYLNPYSNTNITSQQYIWLRHDLAVVDRNATPWVFVIMHCPWYSSNKNHYGDKQTVWMRTTMEKLLYDNNVNAVFSGHVHAYERSYPVYKNDTNKYAPIYITIGDGGNLEGLDNNYYPQPQWSAFRNGTLYGYGLITLFDKTRMKWSWYQNRGISAVARDSVVLCNSLYGSAMCYPQRGST